MRVILNDSFTRFTAFEELETAWKFIPLQDNYTGDLTPTPIMEITVHPTNLGRALRPALAENEEAFHRLYEQLPNTRGPRFDSDHWRRLGRDDVDWNTRGIRADGGVSENDEDEDSLATEESQGSTQDDDIS